MFVGLVWQHLYLILGTEPIFFLHWVGRRRELSSFRPSSFHFPHFFFSSASRGGDSNRPGEVHGFPSRVWFACCFFALIACVVLLVGDQSCFREGVVLNADLSMFLRIFFLPCFDPPRRLPIQHMLRSRSCVLVLIPVLFRWVSVLLAAYFRRLFLLVVSEIFFDLVLIRVRRPPLLIWHVGLSHVLVFDFRASSCFRAPFYL